jgi:hypothetical protein
MDVDDMHKYDEYVRGPAREVITVDTKIKPTNIGFAMLAKMGWQEGQPVGLSGEGLYIYPYYAWTTEGSTNIPSRSRRSCSILCQVRPNWTWQA